jgi:AraC family transcriptional regulator, glycine betaine-responsive activator
MELRARLGVSHPKLLAAIGEMDKRLEEPVSCTELAAKVCLTSRQLERLFQRYLQTSPARYYQVLRLNRARQLLRQTAMPVLSVGLVCGFVSASHFSKCYAEHFRRTPTGERKSTVMKRHHAAA